VNWFAVRSSREPIGLQDEQTQTLAAHYTFQFFLQLNETRRPARRRFSDIAGPILDALTRLGSQPFAPSE
jgi:hypothetical protein